MSEPVPRGVKVAASWAWRFLVIIAAVGLIVFGLMKLADIMIPIMVSILLTVLIRPVALWLHRRTSWNMHVTGMIALLSVLLVVVGLLTVAVQQLIRGFPEVRDQAVEGLNQVFAWLQNSPFAITDAQYTEITANLMSNIQDNAGRIATGAVSVTGTAGAIMAGLAITLFTTYFFVAEGDRIWRWIMLLLPRTSRQPIHEAFRRGWRSLGAYVQTQIIVAAVDSVGIALGALALGLPFVVPIGLIVFFGSFVPIVGALVTGALAVLVALVVKGPPFALIMLIIILAVQQLEGHVLQPFLMGKAVSLHPLAVLLGVIAGTSLGGIIGAMFAVPALALANSVVLYWVGRDQFPALGSDPLRPVPTGVPDASSAGAVADPGGPGVGADAARAATQEGESKGERAEGASEPATPGEAGRDGAR
ncbi:AI-2E family transporter [Micrococcales bacterium 31B]|nr:AI-2E family transporter [Micrococcales bacterium 31B]